MASLTSIIPQKINFLQPNFRLLLKFIRCSKRVNTPRLRHPPWLIRKEKADFQENLTRENKDFIKEIIHDRYGPPAVICGVATYDQSPLIQEPMKKGIWRPGIRRTGLIARKIGIYPMWTKDGTKILTTLLQVLDNHVVAYVPPEDYSSPRNIPKSRYIKGLYGSLIVGAISTDPQKFTKEYCGLFAKSGVMPKAILTRFLIFPEAAVQPGTPLYATHFHIGDYVDVTGITIDRGFQGVMKRWGFKGMPASHGVTKTHRRPGNIGGGGEKARVWPGTKLPGHMGNDKRTLLGLQVLRINTKYNVIWVQGPAIPGNTNSIVYIRDTLLPNKKFKEKPENFPTYFPEEYEEPLPEEILLDKMHAFTDPTIEFAE